MQEMIAPEGATRKAVQACASVMQELLRIGWTKDQIPELEALWWSLRDADGKLKGGQWQANSKTQLTS